TVPLLTPSGILEQVVHGRIDQLVRHLRTRLWLTELRGVDLLLRLELQFPVLETTVPVIVPDGTDSPKNFVTPLRAASQLDVGNVRTLVLVDDLHLLLDVSDEDGIDAVGIHRLHVGHELEENSVRGPPVLNTRLGFLGT